MRMRLMDKDDLSFHPLRDDIEEICSQARGDPMAALRGLLAYAREREEYLKEDSNNPPEGHTHEGLYCMGMATEYMADMIEGVICLLES